MKKTIVLSHPKLAESAVQSFLLEGLNWLDAGVNIIKLDQKLLRSTLSLAEQRELILNSAEVFLQFPLYWYSAPASLAQWQEELFTDKFVHELQEKNKVQPATLAAVISMADKSADFGAGARIGRTISELLSPFQSFAEKVGFSYRKPFIIEQFNYQTPKQQERTLIEYLMYIADADASFEQRSEWLLAQLTKIEQTANSAILRDYLQQQLDEYRLLDATLGEIKNDRE